jgi:hypothetical protein
MLKKGCIIAALTLAKLCFASVSTPYFLQKICEKSRSAPRGLLILSGRGGCYPN